jgi:CHAD domain-containing protein
MTAEIQSQLRTARAELEHICKLLESPTPAVLDRCAAIMERVTSELMAGRQWMAQAGELGIAEAHRLRVVIRRARALLELALSYHTRWRDILAGISGGYTARGAPAPILARVRVSIEG